MINGIVNNFFHYTNKVSTAIQNSGINDIIKAVGKNVFSNFTLCCSSASRPSKKTGLLPQETAAIDDYISAHLKEWEAKAKLGGKDLTWRIEKENSKLPRTLHVVMDEGKMRVMVLCKRKGVAELGAGHYKRTTLAIDWIDKSEWAYSVSKFGEANSERAVLEHEIKMTNLVGEREALLIDAQSRIDLLHPIGLIEYTHKSEIPKTGFFTRRMDGDLRKGITEKRFSYSEKIKIMRDIIDQVYVMQQKGIEHRDLTADNVLYVNTSRRVRAVVIDYAYARQEKERMSEKEIYNKHNNTVGSSDAHPPEVARDNEIYSWRPKNQELLKALEGQVDKNWKKRDVWAVGCIMYGLMTNHVQSGYTTSKIKVIGRERLFKEALEKSFFENVFKDKTAGKIEHALVPEPKLGTLDHLIWQATQYDPERRCSIESLREQFLKFIS